MTANLADLFAEEPPDGTHLALLDGVGDPIVVWRDDAEAKNWYGTPEERWFYSGNSDPMTFASILTSATQVHAVVPLAESGLSLVEQGFFEHAEEGM